MIDKQNNRIEDKIFASALEAKGIKRTKGMYTKGLYPHTCRMCGENSRDIQSYILKSEYVTDFNTPYLFICEECYEELDDEKN